MRRFVAGLALGLVIAGAASFAQITDPGVKVEIHRGSSGGTSSYDAPAMVYLPGGVKPDETFTPLMLDSDSRVLAKCDGMEEVLDLLRRMPRVTAYPPSPTSPLDSLCCTGFYCGPCGERVP